MSKHVIPSVGHYGYIAFWRGHEFHIWSDEGIYPAQLEVRDYIARTMRPRGKKWQYEVNIMLAEKNGEAVVHTADF